MKNLVFELTAALAVTAIVAAVIFVPMHNDSIVDTATANVNFHAEVSMAVDAKVASSSYRGNSVEVTYDNNITFTKTYSETTVQCCFEGSEEIISKKLTDFIKVCFDDLNPQQVQKVIDSLFSTGKYEEIIGNYIYSVSYQSGYVIFELSRK